VTSCGDGKKAGTEACDDGTTAGGDGCAACALEFGYTCNTSVPNVCTTSCGDGKKASAELCDDGNMASNDGCSVTCAVETGYECTGTEPSACGPKCGDLYIRGAEQCDDGGVSDGDGCSSACLWEVVPEVGSNNDQSGADGAGITIENDRVISGGIEPAADVDAFKVTVPAGGSAVRFETFDATGVDCAGITTTLTVRDSAFAALYTSAGDGIGGCSAVVAFLAAGTYYVSVEETGNNATIPSYRLEVNFQTSGGSESASNDTRPTADPLPPTPPPASDVFIVGSRTAGDTSVDVFAIKVPEGKSVRAEIIEGDTSETCESNGIDSLLTLYNAAGTSLTSDNDSGRGECSLIDGTGSAPLNAGAKNLTAGTYYIQVESNGGGSGTLFAYRLDVTIR
jgi:cysteine-rich repeat protein